MIYDVAIIGAGPAGASCALITAKAGKKTVMIDNDKGVTKRAWVENHYGVEKISGPDLVELGQRQAKNFGAELVAATATNIEKNGDHFSIETDGGTYKAKHVVLSTGFLTDLAEKVGIETTAGTEPRVKTIAVVDAAGKTSIDGIWAAGTFAGVSVHTIVTAGDGAKVAFNIVTELNGERYVDHDMIQA